MYYIYIFVYQIVHYYYFIYLQSSNASYSLPVNDVYMYILQNRSSARAFHPKEIHFFFCFFFNLNLKKKMLTEIPLTFDPTLR